MSGKEENGWFEYLKDRVLAVKKWQWFSKIFVFCYLLGLILTFAFGMKEIEIAFFMVAYASLLGSMLALDYKFWKDEVKKRQGEKR